MDFVWRKRCLRSERMKEKIWTNEERWKSVFKFSRVANKNPIRVNLLRISAIERCHAGFFFFLIFCCKWPRFYHKRMHWWNGFVAHTHLWRFDNKPTACYSTSHSHQLWTSIFDRRLLFLTFGSIFLRSFFLFPSLHFISLVQRKSNASHIWEQATSTKLSHNL